MSRRKSPMRVTAPTTRNRLCFECNSVLGYEAKKWTKCKVFIRLSKNLVSLFFTSFILVCNLNEKGNFIMLTLSPIALNQKYSEKSKSNIQFKAKYCKPEHFSSLEQIIRELGVGLKVRTSIDVTDGFLGDKNNEYLELLEAKGIRQKTNGKAIGDIFYNTKEIKQVGKIAKELKKLYLRYCSVDENSSEYTKLLESYNLKQLELFEIAKGILDKDKAKEISPKTIQNSLRRLEETKKNVTRNLFDIKKSSK